MRGANVCTSHGGASPKARAKAAQRLADDWEVAQFAACRESLRRRTERWHEDRVKWAARVLAEDPRTVAERYVSAGGLLFLPDGVELPPNLRLEAKPVMRGDRRFGPRERRQAPGGDDRPALQPLARYRVPTEDERKRGRVGRCIAIPAVPDDDGPDAA